ncbi:SGNH/GDSL hydrolase family protein [bacterium]|nr:SGNH/GDSL hydrolase family protein [bacterium]
MSVTDDLRMLAVGGSTTECFYLDQEEAWPQRVQQILNENGTYGHVWVGNIGRSATDVPVHYVQLKYLLPQIDKIDLIVFLVGVNDMTAFLRHKPPYKSISPYDPAIENRLLYKAFSSVEFLRPWCQKTGFWQIAKGLKHNIYFPLLGINEIEDPSGFIIRNRREKRMRAREFLDSLPSAQTSLDDYRYGIQQCIQLVRAYGAEMIFMTQPTIWSDSMNKTLNKFLWFGWTYDCKNQEYCSYYSTKAIAQAMASYNAILLATCKDMGVPCLDLANLLPKDTTIFFDDMHFNENGSQQVAIHLADFIKDSLMIKSAVKKSNCHTVKLINCEQYVVNN